MHIVPTSVAAPAPAAPSGPSVAVECFTEYSEYGHSSDEACFAVARLKAIAYEASETARAPVDIVAVIDRSGSMGDGKLDLVKQTLAFVVKELTARDRLAIVSYDDTITVDCDLTTMDFEGKQSLLSRVNSLVPGNCTNLSGGLLQGLRVMKGRKEAREVSSVLLFTDGLANAGMTQAPEICRMVSSFLTDSAEEMAKYETEDVPAAPAPRRQSFVQRAMNSIGLQSTRRSTSPPNASFAPASASLASSATSLSSAASTASVASATAPAPATTGKQNTTTVYTFGFGGDHDAAMLKAISETGRGMYYYIRGGEDIATSFADCLGGLLSTVAQGITVTLRPTDGGALGTVHHVGKVTKESGVVKIELCDIQSEEERNFLFEVKLPARTSDVQDEVAFSADIDYFDVVAGVQRHTTSLARVNRVKTVSTTRAQSVDVDVHKTRMESVKAMEEAKAKADSGDIAAARERLAAQMAVMKGKAKATSAHPLSKNIETDMEVCLDGLKDTHSYASAGRQQMNSKQQAWGYERSNEASANVYETKARKAMKSKFI